MKWVVFLLLVGPIFLISTSYPPPTLAEKLYESHDRFKDSTIVHRRFSPEEIAERLTKLDSFAIQIEGKSVEGRLIRSLHIGKGQTRVMLWSQMHGDEATATMAFIDLFRFLEAKDDAFSELRERIKSQLSILFIPILNPDGAARFSRRNALGIDVNRDAQRLTSPEAQILKMVRDSFQAEWGFNMHDQGRFYGVSNTGRPAALAFLAPAFNEERSMDKNREAAMKLIASITQDIDPYIGDYVARYNDAFERRAFGDNFQKWGTRTILVESGIITGDTEKQDLRRLHFVLLLCALDHIARDSWKEASLSTYRSIPYNWRNSFFDLLIRQVLVPDANGKPRLIDLGYRNLEVDWDPSLGTIYNGRIGDIGDLSSQFGHVDLDAQGMEIRKGKVYPRAFRNLDDLLKEDPIEMLANGFSTFQMRSLPGWELRQRLPFSLVMPGKDVRLEVQVEKNPRFFLCQDESCTYYVHNGKLFDLKQDLEVLRQHTQP